MVVEAVLLGLLPRDSEAEGVGVPEGVRLRLTVEVGVALAVPDGVAEAVGVLL